LTPPRAKGSIEPVDKTVLLISANTAFARALSGALYGLGLRVRWARPRPSEGETPGVDGVDTIDWNPGSRVSLRAIAVAARPAPREPGPDALVLLSSREGESSPLRAERAFAEALSGLVLASTEAKALLDDGLLVLALEDRADELRDGAVDSGIGSGFRAWADAALQSGEIGVRRGYGYAVSTQAAGSFAAKIAELLAEDDRRDLGKWSKITGKSGLFGRK
jgi:hypothetical protein